MKVLIKESSMCWVDFYHEVEIDDNTKDEDIHECAFHQFYEDGSEYQGHTVQDSIGFCDNESAIVEFLPCNIK